MFYVIMSDRKSQMDRANPTNLPREPESDLLEGSAPRRGSWRTMPSCKLSDRNGRCNGPRSMRLDKTPRLLWLLLTFAAGPSFAGTTTASPQTINITSTIRSPLTINSSSNLSFGTVLRPTSGSGTLNVSTSGSLTATGFTLTEAGTVSAASVTFKGSALAAVSVIIPSTFTLTNLQSKTLTVTTTNNAGSNLSSTGLMTVQIGGSIPLSTSTSTGTYTGSFTVSASYN
jgi:Domain of unknown function (DUF4402)